MDWIGLDLNALKRAESILCFFDRREGPRLGSNGHKGARATPAVCPAKPASPDSSTVHHFHGAKTQHADWRHVFAVLYRLIGASLT